jgi:predicted small lipoprotein YifL
MPQVPLRSLVLAVLAVAALSAACGKKGPLYLPDEAPRQATPPAGAPAQQP